MAQEVTSSDFSEILNNSDSVILADFYSDTCMPCRRMAPVLSELEGESKGKFTAVKINVASDGELADRYNVEAVPTFILFRNGEEKARIVGAVPKSELSSMIYSN